MIFKHGPIELICSFSIFSAGFENIQIEIKIHNFQIIAKDLKSLANILKLCNFFSCCIYTYPAENILKEKISSIGITLRIY